MQSINCDWQTLRNALMNGEINHNPCQNWHGFGHNNTICPLCGSETELVKIQESEESQEISSYACFACDVAFSVANIQALGTLFTLSPIVKLGVGNE